MKKSNFKKPRVKFKQKNIKINPENGQTKSGVLENQATRALLESNQTIYNPYKTKYFSSSQTAAVLMISNI